MRWLTVVITPWVSEFVVLSVFYWCEHDNTGSQNTSEASNLLHTDISRSQGYVQLTSDLWPPCGWRLLLLVEAGSGVCVTGQNIKRAFPALTGSLAALRLLCISGSDVTAWAAMDVIGCECGISIMMNAVSALSVPSPLWHVWAGPGRTAITSLRS